MTSIGDIPYAICTDVGASPTTSILAEMAQFLKVHAGRSDYATPQEALFRTTLAPAQLLELSDRLGRLEPGLRCRSSRSRAPTLTLGR
jgi:cytosine/adenosine deaminase-related metal-dependent hydrolase